MSQLVSLQKVLQPSMSSCGGPKHRSNLVGTISIGICELVYLGYPAAQRAWQREILCDLGSPSRGSLMISEKYENCEGLSVTLK